mmetsp:Transcript_5303/g.4486  ORF Transcript_5303/g.4486 Transcript_5303/m.4486 type:complete len:337 (-) Transcript_5303:35-1045(-)
MLHILIYPAWYGNKHEFHLLVKALPLLFACMWFLKFLSYHHIWHDVRFHVELSKGGATNSQKDDVKNQKDLSSKTEIGQIAKRLNLPKPILKSVLEYPNNVDFKSVLVFLLVPTLSFQLKYPFNKHRSFLRYLLRMGEYILWTVLWLIIILEYLTPLVLECGASIKREDYRSALYYFIRLAVPNTYSWLIMFYSTFHVFLTAYANLTGFADRCFYLDWWNSKTLGEYWRKWNLPVHNWLTRHIYLPLIRRGFSKFVSMLVVFVFSAIMHEYIVFGLIGYVSGIGFNSMAMQLPFIIIQEKYKKYLGGNVGNFFFWIIFCVIGQPAGMVMGYLWLNA